MRPSNVIVEERSKAPAHYEDEPADQTEEWVDAEVATVAAYAPGAPDAFPTVPPAVAPGRLSLAWHRAIQGVFDGFKRLEGLSLRNFRNGWYSTPVGQIHTLECGQPHPSRPSWVFIHGFAASAVDWAPLLRRLSRVCGHIVSIDLPGHGRSPLPFAGAAGLTQPNLLVALRETIEQSTAGGQAVVVGNSTGGLGAIRMAQLLGKERVPYLVLISPLGSPMTGCEIDQVLQQFHLSNYGDGLQFIDRLFVNGSKLRPVTAMAIWSHLKRPHLLGFAEQLRNDFPFLRPDELRDLPPSLLIWGDADMILPASGRQFLSKHLPNHHLVQTRNFSHAPFLDLADDVADEVVRWAARQPGIWGTEAAAPAVCAGVSFGTG